tara:strand:+ start:1067 stop:1792 length:726 start_codon:yes stop_codon:yes gene_type:complete
MAKFVVKNRPIWLGDLKISGLANQAVIDYGAEAQDCTTFDDIARSNIGGLLTLGFSIDVYSDFAPNVGSRQFKLDAYRGQEVPWTFASEDGSVGEVAYLTNAVLLQYSPLSGAVGDIAGGNLQGGTAGKLVRGIIEFNGTASSSSDSTGSQLGALSASQSLYCNLHVTDATSGTTLDVDVESDDNGSFTSATTRGSFSQVTTSPSEEHLIINGAVTDDYWRISYTVSGSYAFAVSLGIATT